MSSSANSNSFYGGSAPNRRVPPPKPVASTAARRTNANKMRAKPAYQSNRSVPSSTAAGTATTTTAAAAAFSKRIPTRSKASTTTTTSSKISSSSTSSKLPLSSTSSTSTPLSSPTSTSASTSRSGTSGLTARKAPVASRPVGSYYNSTSSTNGASGAGVGAHNPYASAVVPPSTPTTTGKADTTDNYNGNDNDNDTWDDWGSPAPTNTTSTATTAAISTSTSSTHNQYSSWAAPAPGPTPSTLAPTNDWYSAGSSATNPSAAAVPTGYSSSGFANQPSSQPMQQQRQQTPMQPGTGFYGGTKPQQQQQTFLSGAMDSSAPIMSAQNANTNNGMAKNTNNMNMDPTASSMMSAFTMFMPKAATAVSSFTPEQPQDPTDPYPSIEDEAPLLEELGINIPNILIKSKAVILPFSRFGGNQIDPVGICRDGDLAGPVACLLLLGGEMVLAGKLRFGYIYVYGLAGCIAMTFVVNLICPTGAVSFWTVTSIMGYSLIPVNILALAKIFVVNLINMQQLGNVLGGLTILWSTWASTRLLELGCGMRDQRYLVMYPLFLFYSAFVMMTIL